MKKCGYCLILCACVITAVLLSGLYGGRVFAGEDNKKDYGVFLSLDASNLDKLAAYRTVVIDAQYFTKKDIAYLKKQGCRVYSYFNVGSLEQFREYYHTYEDLTLGEYENWEDEKWMDVSDARWQKFLASLERKLIKKGIDGFFVDNCDVYYRYPGEEMFKGLTLILKHLRKYGKPVIINGGDTYVMEYRKRNGTLTDIMTAVNQECVFSRIDFDTGKFSSQKKSDRDYFLDYVETCDRAGLDVYLLEYTRSRALKSKIIKYCRKKHFHYYISKSMELN